MSFLMEVTERLSETPLRAAELIRGLSEQQLWRKPSVELFSMRENILHLRDIEVVGYEPRIRMILQQDTPRLPDVDGGETGSGAELRRTADWSGAGRVRDRAGLECGTTQCMQRGGLGAHCRDGRGGHDYITPFAGNVDSTRRRSSGGHGGVAAGA